MEEQIEEIARKSALPSYSRAAEALAEVRNRPRTDQVRGVDSEFDTTELRWLAKACWVVSAVVCAFFLLFGFACFACLNLPFF